MTIKLLDYEAIPVEVEVGDINDIGRMTIKVLSGDEVLTVIYKDFTSEEFDSCNIGRYVSYYDGEYDIYNAATGFSCLNDKAFMDRHDSYSYMYYDGDEEDEEES